MGEVVGEDGDASHAGSIDRAREAAFREAAAMGATNVETKWYQTGGDGTARAVYSGIAYSCPGMASPAAGR
jgi:predicted polyphosphate/ATP-dependent NAD kinase